MKQFSERIRQAGSKLIHELDGELIVIEGWGRDGLRVRARKGAEILHTQWALTEAVQSDATIEINETKAVIRNGKISATIQDIYTQKGYLQFFRHSGDETISILSEQDYVVHAHNPGTRVFKARDDELFHTELHFAPRKGERFYGMGLNATGQLNLKGTVIGLYQRHIKHVVPFVVSSEGYGFLWNNPGLGQVEFGNNLTRWTAYGCRQLDYYITAGDSFADILENYTGVSGRAPEFPYWASGFWQCKLRYKTQEEFLDVAREFKQRGLPLSVHVIDFLHWKHTGDWKLDPDSWPDPPAMVKELDEMGVRIMISPWILVDEQSENFVHMKERGLFTRSIDGTKDTVDFGGISGENPQKYQYDPTNPEAARYLWDKWKTNYVDLGIRTFWLDPCDDFHAITDYDQILYHIGPAIEAHNYYPVAHQKNIFEGLHSAGETEVVTICRSSWAGSQRYGASPAVHDIMSSFEHLHEYMMAGLNLSMSGIPWGAAEIGGFVTFDNTSERFHELMVRWYQYGVFCPIFRTHGFRPNNEAWNIGGNAYPHIRAAMFLRERLRPYVMQQMKLASEKGIPPMRPVFFDFAEDPQTYTIEDQLLFGSDLLVAPVTAYGVRSRQVYLPIGADWLCAWSGELIAGGTTLDAEAPIEHIPVFVNAANSQLLALFKDIYTL